MTDNMWFVYWVTRVDGIIGLLMVVAGIMLFYGILSSFDDDEFKIKPFAICIAIGIICVFIPTSSDIVKIYAGGKTLDFVQQDTSLSKIPSKTTEIVFQVMDNLAKELKEKK